MQYDSLYVVIYIVFNIKNSLFYYHHMTLSATMPVLDKERAYVAQTKH